MLEHAKVKYYRQDYEWSAVPYTLTCTGKTLYLAPSVGAESLRVVTISFLLTRFTHSIDSDICQPILIILLAMTFCLDAKINQMNLTNPFPKGTGDFDKVW